jgi:hypothetical protein
MGTANADQRLVLAACWQAITQNPNQSPTRRLWVKLVLAACIGIGALFASQESREGMFEQSRRGLGPEVAVWRRREIQSLSTPHWRELGDGRAVVGCSVLLGGPRPAFKAWAGASEEA